MFARIAYAAVLVSVLLIGGGSRPVAAEPQVAPISLLLPTSMQAWVLYESALVSPNWACWLSRHDSIIQGYVSISPAPTAAEDNVVCSIAPRLNATGPYQIAFRGVPASGAGFRWYNFTVYVASRIAFGVSVDSPGSGGNRTAFFQGWGGQFVVDADIPEAESSTRCLSAQQHGTQLVLRDMDAGATLASLRLNCSIVNRTRIEYRTSSLESVPLASLPSFASLKVQAFLAGGEDARLGFVDIVGIMDFGRSSYRIVPATKITATSSSPMCFDFSPRNVLNQRTLLSKGMMGIANCQTMDFVNGTRVCCVPAESGAAPAVVVNAITWEPEPDIPTTVFSTLYTMLTTTLAPPVSTKPPAATSIVTASPTGDGTIVFTNAPTVAPNITTSYPPISTQASGLAPVSPASDDSLFGGMSYQLVTLIAVIVLGVVCVALGIVVCRMRQAAAKQEKQRHHWKEGHDEGLPESGAEEDGDDNDDDGEEEDDNGDTVDEATVDVAVTPPPTFGNRGAAAAVAASSGDDIEALPVKAGAAPAAQGPDGLEVAVAAAAKSIDDDAISIGFDSDEDDDLDAMANGTATTLPVRAAATTRGGNRAPSAPENTTNSKQPPQPRSASKPSKSKGNATGAPMAASGSSSTRAPQASPAKQPPQVPAASTTSPAPSPPTGASSRAKSKMR